MEFKKVSAILIVLLSVAVAEKVRFDNYRVYSIKVENEEQLAALKNIENNPDGVGFSIFQI